MKTSCVASIMREILLVVLAVTQITQSSADISESRRRNSLPHPLAGKQSFIQIRTGHINPEDGSKVMKTNQTYYDDAINNGLALIGNLTRGLAVEDPENGEIAPQLHNCSYDFSHNKWHIPSPLTFYCDTSASFVLRFELSVSYGSVWPCVRVGVHTLTSLPPPSVHCIGLDLERVY